jgi:hypothetical protein
MDVRQHTGTPVSGTRQRGWFGAAIFVMVLISAAACRSPNAQSIAPTTTSTHPVAPSTTTVAQVQAAIISQWRSAEEASVAAAKDPGNPGRIVLLDDYFVDPALSFQRINDAAYARDGLTNVGDIDNGAPRVESMTATQAVVVSCTTNRLALVYKTTGKPFPGSAGDPTPTHNGIRSTMVLTPSGVWKLSSTVLKEGSCDGF